MGFQFSDCPCHQSDEKKQLTKTKEQQQPTHANPMNPQQKDPPPKTRENISCVYTGPHRRPRPTWASHRGETKGVGLCRPGRRRSEAREWSWNFHGNFHGLVWFNRDFNGDFNGDSMGILWDIIGI